MAFSNEIPKITRETVLPKITEFELLGALFAFLVNYMKDMQVYTEYGIPVLAQHRKLFADLYIESKNENVIIEVKSSLRQNPNVIKGGTDQLLNYLLLAGLSNGILYIPPRNDTEKMIVSSIEKVIENKIYNIFHVYPKNLVNDLDL